MDERIKRPYRENESVRSTSNKPDMRDRYVKDTKGLPTIRVWRSFEVKKKAD